MRKVAVAAMVIGVLLAGVGVVGLAATAGDEAGTDDTAGPTSKATSTSATSTTVATTATTTTTVEAAVRAFVPELVAAIRAGDNGYKFERLHPLVVQRYGEATCRSGLTAAQPDFVMDVVSVGAPEPWDWVTDGLTTSVVAIPVNVKRSGADGALVDGVIHLAEAEGAMRWFTDCGTPSSS